MGDTLEKVQAGQPLAIPAQAYNAFIDAAWDFEARQRNRKQDPTRRVSSSGIVPLENASRTVPANGRSVDGAAEIVAAVRKRKVTE